MRTTSSTILKPCWDARRLNLLQHEYGVRVDEECGDFSPVGAEVRAWINLNRSRGWGQVIPLNELLRKVEWEFFGAWTFAERRQVKHAAIDFVVRLLNDPRNGLTTARRDDRCHRCGGAA